MSKFDSIDRLLQNWKGTSNGEGEPLALKWVVESLIGAIYQDKGAKAAKEFIHAHVLSRSVDIESHVAFFLKMRQPRHLLVTLSKNMDKNVPVARYVNCLYLLFEYTII